MNARRAGTLAALAVVSLFATGGCIASEVKIIGQTGISVDGAGKPVVVVAICEEHVNFIDIYFDREGLKETEENEKVGAWTTSKPIRRTGVLDIEAPGQEWSPDDGVTIESERGYIVESAATDTDEDLAATQVAFTGKDLSKMRTDSVYTNVNDLDSKKLKRYDLATFRADICGEGS